MEKIINNPFVDIVERLDKIETALLAFSGVGNSQKPQPTYSLQEAAEFLRIRPTKCYELALTGALKGSKIGSKWLFTLRDLQNYIDRTRSSTKL